MKTGGNVGISVAKDSISPPSYKLLDLGKQRVMRVRLTVYF